MQPHPHSIDDGATQRPASRSARLGLGVAVPHPIPYQGSKRLLAARILARLPARFDVLHEPFCGSAAISLATARLRPSVRFAMGDGYAPLCELWTAIHERPVEIADAYERTWNAQLADPRAHYDRVRVDFNRAPTPAGLLFLLARCVKSAVRFNASGEFNQSSDARRLGTRPATMRANVLAASELLRGRATVRVGDYDEALDRATPRDVVYLDPPYQGTSRSRDTRYHQQLDLPRFVTALERLRARRVPLLLSFDGRTGERTYGPELPAELGLTRLELDAGRSSQATLSGRDDVTFESLYVSPELAS